MTNLADKTAKDLDYITPESLLIPVREFFGGQIPLDPATLPNNPTKALRFFIPEDDGLVQSWRGEGVFLNPPYGKNMKNWCRKIALESSPEPPAIPVTIIALLPGGSRTETKYWQDHVFNPHLNVVCYVRKRVAFLRPSTGEPAKGNTFGSGLYGFNVSTKRFLQCFGHLGACMKVTRLATS